MSVFQFGRSLLNFKLLSQKPDCRSRRFGPLAPPGLTDRPDKGDSEVLAGFTSQQELPEAPGFPADDRHPHRENDAAPTAPRTSSPRDHTGPAQTALVHDYLAQSGGAERVIAALHALFPTAPLYTSVYDPRATLPCFAQMDVRTSFLQRSVLASRRFHKLALGLYPTAFEQFDLSGFALVISSSSSFAKGVITGPETCHICYCHTPARFAWRQHEYLQQSRLTRLLAPWMRGMITDLRQWDTDSAQRADYMIANSHNVAGRIRKYYRREADAVIYPPVETRRFALAPAEEVGDHFLIVSRLVGYKRVDLAIEACNRLRVPLRVVGAGPERRALQRMAGPTIQFLGRLPDAQVAEEYARCRALIFPGDEDFGLTPLECMASGRPVVAYGRGGALETVTMGKTGVFFEEQTPEAVMEALQAVSTLTFDPQVLQQEAARFDTAVFAERMRAFVAEATARHRRLYQCAGSDAEGGIPRDL